VGARGNAVGEFAVDGVEGVEEGFGFGFEAEEERGTQNAREAEVIVVHGREPVLRAGGEGGGALDGHPGRGGNLAEPIEAQHALEGLAEAILHGDGGVKNADGEGIEDGGGGIGAAGLGERKEPLNEVVDGFEAVVVPGKNLRQRAAFVVGRAVAIEGGERRYLRVGQR
jgi:hypothetical protein